MATHSDPYSPPYPHPSHPNRSPDLTHHRPFESPHPHQDYPHPNSYSLDYHPSPSSSAPPPIPPNPYLHRSASRTPYSSPPPPPGALPPANPGPVTPPIPTAEYSASHVRAGYAGWDAGGQGTSPTSPESDRAWRESRIISMYGGGGAGSVTNSPPTEPRGASRLGTINGGGGDYFRSSSDLTPPPASPVADPVDSTSAAYARSQTQPAYPAYAAARATSTSSTHSYRGADASAGKRPSNPPPLPGTFRQRGSRTSDDSSQYSIYSYHSNDSGPSTVVGPPPALGARNRAPSSPPVPQRKQSLEHMLAMQQQLQQGQGASPIDHHRPRFDSFASSHYSSYSVPEESTVPQLPPLPLSLTSPISTSFASSSVSAPTPAPPPAPRSRQPTILMSPPLDAHAEGPAPLHRNRSIDSTWSPSISSSSFQSHPTFSTVPTSPGPSPSLSQSFSFSSDISRRPSQATLSPLPSSLDPSPYLLRAESGDSFSSSAPSPHAADGAEFLNPAFLSDLAVFLKDRVPRGPRQKGAVEHWGFTGDEVVSALVQALPGSSSAGATLAPPPPPSGAGPTAAVAGAGGGAAGRERKLALGVARELHRALWFHEVDWDDAPLQDAPAQVFAFLRDERDASGAGGTTRDDEADREEIPTGVVTELTKCYSPFCAKGNAEGAVTPGGGVLGGCYAYSCPNRQNTTGLQRVGSTLSAYSASTEPQEEADNWATSVPRAVLESLDKKQIAYQNQVFELIHGEQKYYDDLLLIETGFVEPLWTAQPPIIPHDRLASFLSSVLLNISTIRLHSRAFLDALRAKQAEAHVVGGIGRIVLAAAVEWGPAYIQFTIGFPMADWCFKEEKRTNPRFNELLMDFHKRPEASKRGFDTFQSRATFRGLRYILLLEQILKNAPESTPEEREDREYLAEAINVIRQQGKDADEGIGEVKKRVALREFERDLLRKQGDTLDLELLDESRRFFMASKVYRRPEGSGFTDQWHEAHLVLFDNYLVTTKAPRPDRDGRQRYLISRRPVPLDLIQLKTTSFTEPPVPRSSGFHLRPNRSAGSPQPALPASASYHPDASSSSHSSSLLYPISFFQMGRFDGLVHVYVDSPAQRSEWEQALKEAISLRSQRQEANRVVRIDPLADQTFGTTSSIGSLTAGAPGGNQFGRPTCSTPLMTVDGLWLVLAGCAEGIFIGWRGRPKSMQQVVHLAGITQCAVLPDFSFLLVVANKVLVAYALEALIPTKTASKLDQASKAPQRLSGQKDVSFFRVGKVGDADPRTLVIYAKKSGVKESVFKALEPVSQSDRAKGGGGSGHRGFLGFGSGRPEWFRTYKEFFMPSLVTSLQFQRSKLALIGSRGVEIMDLESMRTMTVPDFPSVRHNRAFAPLAKRCEEVPTLGMFRIADSKFVLVYADFAFHVGRHGEPVEGPFIEWESKPEQVAYCAPYIFAISPTIIEIRHAFTGRLAQFIIGSHIHLTYDGSAIPSSNSILEVRSPRVSAGSMHQDQDQDDANEHVEKRLHVSMRSGAFHVLYEIVVVA
ncbi:hypothetical protein JCM1840_006035 [Sporobolomyces johnsonii]